MGEIKCLCCGDTMEPVEDLKVSIKYRCKGCGLSDTRLKTQKAG